MTADYEGHRLRAVRFTVRAKIMALAGFLLLSLVGAAFAPDRTARLAIPGLALVLGGVAAFRFARITGRRLGNVTVMARGVAAGDLSAVIPATRNDEIGDNAIAMQGMSEYLRHSAAVAKRLAEGDLTVEVELASENDEFGLAFQLMTANLREMVSGVSRAATMMGSSSQQMAASSEETGKAVGEIAQAVSDVAQGAERQVQMVEQARAAADETTAAAASTAQLARTGVETVAKASDAMQAMAGTAAEVTEIMNNLVGESERIGGIVETITEISGQTNLLALNAAIEAARAGDQGKGFAVVADEVRKLAEESQEAAGSIAELIERVQRDIHNITDIGAKRDELAGSAMQRQEEAAGAFREIQTAIAAMHERTTRIAEATAEVASVAEQSSASSEQVSASTEETSASAQEVAASAQELAGTADELNRLLTQFKVAG